MSIEETDDYSFDLDEEGGFTNCPNCNTEYDEIDYEYQICHYCKFNANNIKYL